MGGDLALLDAPHGDVVSAKALDEIRIHSLNVGAGSCHVVECPGNTAPILYDCGRTSRSDPDMTGEEVVNYANGIFNQYEAAPIVIVSHGDRDHYRYIPSVMGDRIASAVWFGGRRGGYSSEMRDWFGYQDDNGVDVIGGFDSLTAGFSNSGRSCSGSAMWPCVDQSADGQRGTTKNAGSLVVRIEHGDFSVTLTGDATGETENRAIENFAELETTLLAGSHHGASTEGSNGQGWADATRPHITLFSSGTSYGHPRCVVMERFESSLASVSSHDIQCGVSNTEYRIVLTQRAQYVTRVNGTVVVSSDGESPPEVECTLTSDCGF